MGCAVAGGFIGFDRKWISTTLQPSQSYATSSCSSVKLRSLRPAFRHLSDGLLRQSWWQQDWCHCKTSCPSGRRHCLVVSPDSTLMYLHTSPNPMDADGPLHWPKARHQMATDPWSTTKDLVIPDLDWSRSVTPQLLGRLYLPWPQLVQWCNGPQGLCDGDDVKIKEGYSRCLSKNQASPATEPPVRLYIWWTASPQPMGTKLR